MSETDRIRLLDLAASALKTLPDTPFVRWARAQDVARAEQGFGMLIEQAAESFRIWRGVRPDTAPLHREAAAR